MSDKLNYIRQAIAKGETRVNVVRTRTNSSTGSVEIDATISVNAQTALKLLTMPFNQRPLIWKRIQPLGFDATGYARSAGSYEKPDTNPLSLDNLKDAVMDNPEALEAILEAVKAKKKAEKDAAKGIEIIETTEPTQ